MLFEHDAYAAIVADMNADLAAAVEEFMSHVRVSDYRAANSLIKNFWHCGMKAGQYRALSDYLNAHFLLDASMEMTSHGIFRSFRFWSDAEKSDYLSASADLIERIRETITDRACVGYGTALALARSNDLIAHDDDIDLLVGLPRAEFPSYDSAVHHVIGRLGGDDILVRQAEPFLVHVRSKARNYKTDIFVGIEDDGYFSSFPGPYRKIEAADLFPPARGSILGVDLPVPARIEAYLEKVYGKGWSEPDPHFSHNWSRRAHRSLFG